MNKQLTTKKIVKWVFFLALIGLVFWGLKWATFARPPLQEAVAALEGDDQVRITQDSWLTFFPTGVSPDTGFIFYPGGRIDPQGYAPLMKAIASQGFLVVIPEMPINMAVFNSNIADDVIVFFPQINHWVIGGHSVGGTMAAQYSQKHPDEIDGLVIWASYPADNADLSDYDIPVISIYGSLDPRVNDESISKRQHLLPDHTQYIRIQGGDHHQFGFYEINPEDNLATISRASQHEQILQATLNLMDSLSGTQR